MYAVLIGASPFGSNALAKLGMQYICITEPEEYLSRLAHPPILHLAAPYRQNCASVLTLPLPEDIAAVVSFTEHGLLPAAMLAEALGVPTVSTSAVARTRNKLLMRRTLKDLVRQPRFGVLTEVCHDIVFPAIIKPADGAGSEGVNYVESPADLDALALCRPGLWIWEEYVPGPEYSVETVTFNGKHHVLAVTQKETTGVPHFVEIGHVSPAPLSAGDVAQITSEVCKCLTALNVTLGAAHTEVKYIRPHTYIIETHTRPGGDRIPLLAQLVTGYDQYELAVRSSLGLEYPEPTPPKHRVAAVRFFEWRPGTIRSVVGVENCTTLPGVVELNVKAKPGTTLHAWKSSLDRPGFVVVADEDTDAVMSTVRTIKDLVSIQYE